MDPGTMMMLASLASSAAGQFTGQNAKPSSSFSSGQKGGIQDLLDAISGMRGGQQDITGNQNYQQGQDWLQSMFSDPEFFNKFEAPMMRNYEENTIPDLANRFAGMGTGGALGSTGFRNQATREAGNLHANMAAMRGGLQSQGVNQSMQYAQQPFQNLMQMYQQALGQPVNNQYQPATAGMGNLAAPFASGAASYWGAGGGMGGGNQGGGMPDLSGNMFRGYSGQ
jgi:hypothetical protein